MKMMKLIFSRDRWKSQRDGKANKVIEMISHLWFLGRHTPPIKPQPFSCRRGVRIESTRVDREKDVAYVGRHRASKGHSDDRVRT